MKIVIDTSVVIAAFAARGLCYAVYELCLDKHECFTSEYILGEIKRGLIRKIHVPLLITEEAISDMRARSIVVKPVIIGSEVCRDKTDLPILGTAVAAHAECLISVDKDLLTIKQMGEIEILSPRQFWEKSAALPR